MLLSSRLPLSSLIEVWRVLRHYLGAGLTLRDVFLQQARKGSAAVRPLAARIAAALEQGSDLEDALKREGDAFPPLFRSLAVIGEQTGMLPEVFTELEKYYARQRKLRRQFWSQATWPLVQFFLAIFVLAGLILVLGMLPVNQRGDGQGYDPLGLGLTGPSGALIFLGAVFGALLALAVVYLLATQSLKQKESVDRSLLRLPVVGPCLEALALARFCLALRLTTETGMATAKALRLSLRATGNTAFAGRGEEAVKAVRAGDDLTLALTRTGVFPEDFRNMLAVAEESGRLDEVLRHQADHYHEESGRRLSTLTSVAGYAVWFVVGALIVVAIFRLALTYIGALNAV